MSPNKQTTLGLFKQDLRDLRRSSVTSLIISISFLLKCLFILLVLPKSATNFAPDEGTYSGLAQWVSEDLPLDEFPGFSEHLYLQSRSFIVPASHLIDLGLGPFTATRMVSNIYGTLSAFLLYFILRKFCENSSADKSRIRWITYVAITSYVFFPSFFLWSTLALRESTSQFYLLLTLYLVMLLLKQTKSFTFLGITSLIFAITLNFNARPSTALAFSLILVTCLPLFTLKSKTKTMMIGGALLIGIFFGTASKTLFWFESPQNSKVETSSENSTLVVTREIANISKNIFSAVSAQNRRNLNTEGANSAFSSGASKCGRSDLTLNHLFCVSRLFLVQVHYIAIRPLPGLDKGSSNLTLASLENLLWTLLFILLIIQLRKMLKVRILFEIQLIPIVWSFAFLFFSTMYEGNMGSAFRHKSSILWSVLLSICIFYLDSAAERKKTKTL